MTSSQMPIQQDQSSLSVFTMGSRHPYLTEPIASKRVSFYKSGDPQFSALRMVINSRTFKTFDALLDSLSKKVPLPFGVRNITTPHGVHTVRTLEELEDGKAYICSDQKKVKPFNLEMASRKLPPWYHAHPISARSRTLQMTNLKDGRFLMRDGPAFLRTPKRLTVFRNGDPGHKHTVILARKTTPTFDSLLDHVSEVLRFHVVKLYTSDGRRVNSLPALIMSSGIVVAAGHEHFKPGSYSIQKPAPRTRRRLVNHRMQQHRVQLLTRKNKLLSRSSKTRKFSPASERYIANQISSSITGSLFELPSDTVGSVETGTNNLLQSMEADTCSYMEGDPILPPDDDIEKSFRVNSDGSMTVEMKVRLTVKEEEIVHWTTTLSRSSVANQLKAGCIPQNKPSCHTPDSNAISTKTPNDKVEKNEYMSSKQILSYGNRRFCDEVVNDIGGDTTNLDRLSFKRQQTPGPRGTQKQLASVESIRDVSAIDNQDNMVGKCTYLEETGSYEVTEKYHVVRECSSWPFSKPRKNGSMEVNNNSPGTNEKSSSVAEVLQIHNSGEEITETVLKLYEQQSYCDSFFENMPWSRSMCGSLCRQQSIAETATCSSSNDYEMELQRPYTCSEAIIRKKRNKFPLLSDLTFPILTQSHGLASISKYPYTLYTDSSGMLVNDKKCPEYLSGKAKDDSALLDQRIKNKSLSITQSTGSDKKQKENSVDVKKNQMVKAGPVAQSASGKWVENGHRPSKKPNAAKLLANLKGTTHRFLSENICEVNIENSLHPEKDLNLLAENTVHGGPSNLNKRENVLDVLSSLDSGHSRKILTREKSKQEERRDVNEAGELSERISVSSLRRSHSTVRKDVADCVEKSQSEPNPHIAMASNVQVNKKPKVVFQLESGDEISPEMSEVNYKVNKPIIAEMLSSEGNVAKESSSHIPVYESFAELSGGHGHKVGDLCAINQSGCIKPSKGATGTKCHRTSIRIPAKDEDPFPSRMTGPSDVRNILQQLCQSIQVIRPSLTQKQPSCLEKSQSFPGFSSHVTSTFDSSSKMLLPFSSIVAAKEGVSDFVTDETVARNGSCTEALKVMEALKKIASIEHAEELKASLTELQKSTSSQPMQSWRTFQEFSDKVEDVMDDSDLKCLFIPWREGYDNQVGQTLENHELVAQVKISEKYQDTLSAFANAVAACVNLDEESAEYTVALIDDIVNHTSEPVTEEESISSTESSLKDDLLEGFYEHKTSGLGVQMLSKKDTSVVSELKNHSNTYKRHNKTVDQKIRHKNESLDTKELATCLQEEAVCPEAQDSYAEDDIHCEEWTCYFNKEAKCPEEKYSSNIEEALCREEHDHCLESKSTSVEEQDGFAEGESNCLGQEEEQNNISAENEIGSAEWQDGRGEKQVSWLEDTECDEEKDSSSGQKSMEKQASFEGEKINYGQQIVAGEVQTDSEDKQAGPGGERDGDIEIKDRCDKELWDAEQFTSSISCTEEEATCIEGTLVSTEDATYDNEHMISEEYKAYRELRRKTQKSNTVRYCGTSASSEQELDNFAEQTNHVCFKKLSRVGNALDQITLVKNQDSNVREATHHGKFWGSHEKSRVSCREKQIMYVNRPINERSSTEHRISDHHSAQIDVPNTSIADHLSNDSNISTDQAKIEEFMRETTEVCLKCVDKNVNEIHCVMKNSEEEKPNQRHGSFRESQSVKTLQSVSDTTSSLSSSLAFSYDSKSTLKKDHEGARVKSIKEMFLAKSNTKVHYDQKQLPSPNTSDSSDYVPETSDSGGSHTQTSTNVSTESGEDDCGRRSIAKGYVRRTIERLYGKSEARVEDAAVGMKGKRRESPGNNSVGSEMSAFHETKTKITTDLSYFNATNCSNVSNDNPQCIVLNGQVQRSADVLNERGLLGNQLSGKPPREMLGTQRGKEVIRNESRPENGENEVPYSHFGNHQSTLAVVSSSDVEELVEPEIPKCTYFNLPHGSDSDPFQDDLSSKSQNGARTDDTALKKQDPKPADGVPKMWGDRNGFLPQPPAVFRMPDNKVHPAPASTAAQAVVLQPPKSDFNGPVHEQDTLEMLHFICGQHCPIL